MDLVIRVGEKLDLLSVGGCSCLTVELMACLVVNKFVLASKEHKERMGGCLVVIFNVRDGVIHTLYSICR